MPSALVDQVGYDGLGDQWGVGDQERFMDNLVHQSSLSNRAIEIAVMRLDYLERCRVDLAAMQRVGIPI